MFNEQSKSARAHQLRALLRPDAGDPRPDPRCSAAAVVVGASDEAVSPSAESATDQPWPAFPTAPEPTQRDDGPPRWIDARVRLFGSRRRQMAVAAAVLGPALLALLLRPFRDDISLSTVLLLFLSIVVAVAGIVVCVFS